MIVRHVTTVVWLLGGCAVPVFGQYGTNTNTGGYGTQVNTNTGLPGCQPDASCFRCKAGCALSTALPFERTTTNCEECQAKCLSQRSTTTNTGTGTGTGTIIGTNTGGYGMQTGTVGGYGTQTGTVGGYGTQTGTPGTRSYICETFVYDATYMSCDLYAVAPGSGYPLVRYQSRITCVPMPGCSGTVGPQSGPCPDGLAPVYYRTEGFGFTNGNPTTIPGLSEEQCVQACNTGQNPNGGTLTCEAFMIVGNTCMLYDSAAQPKGTGTLAPNPQATYYERICLPEAQVANCGNLFDRVPQYVLTGFATEVLTVNSFDECMAACLATANCLSGMFYYESPSADGNCILNDGSRDTNPELYGPDVYGDLVDYFQPDCNRVGRDQGFLSKRFRLALNEQALRRLRQDIFRDASSLRKGMQESGSRLEHWTVWSPCDLQRNRQARYRMCPKVDIRKCPSQTKKCQLLDSEDDLTFFKPAIDRKTQAASTSALRRTQLRPTKATQASAMTSSGEDTPCRCLVDSRGRLDCRIGILHRVVDGRRLTQYCGNPVP